MATPFTNSVCTSLWDSLSDVRYYYRVPPRRRAATAAGEKTGSLPPMLERAAQTLSRDIERRAMGMTALLEPLMIVVMGAVVLVIVMAVLLPIIEINQLVT